MAWPQRDVGHRHERTHGGCGSRAPDGPGVTAGDTATVPRMRVVVARCSATYDGRLSSTLAPGVRMVMVKADGCVAIHADVGAYKPLNWMNAPNTLVEDGSSWTVTNPAGEVLVITFDEVLETFDVDLDTERGLTLDGVEKDLQALLADHPDQVEEGLVLVRREYPTDLGPVDLLCRDPAGVAVAVEVKRIGEIDGVEQLTRYLDRLERDPLLAPVRGILAATVVKPQARVLATARGLGWAEVDLAELRAADDVHLRLF